MYIFYVQLSENLKWMILRNRVYTNKVFILLILIEPKRYDKVPKNIQSQFRQRIMMTIMWRKYCFNQLHFLFENESDESNLMLVSKGLISASKQMFIFPVYRKPVKCCTLSPPSGASTERRGLRSPLRSYLFGLANEEKWWPKSCAFL